MNGTTARLVDLWERFPELRPDENRLLFTRKQDGSFDQWYVECTHNEIRANEWTAHAIAGWSLLEWLADAGYGVDFVEKALMLKGAGGNKFFIDEPSRLDTLISAVWSAKGEDEPAASPQPS